MSAALTEAARDLEARLDTAEHQDAVQCRDEGSRGGVLAVLTGLRAIIVLQRGISAPLRLDRDK